jgi:hypothetical protein
MFIFFLYKKKKGVTRVIIILVIMWHTNRIRRVF